MKILAIDTSSKICSVAITEDDKKIIELHSDDEKTHSVKLMPMIDTIFQSVYLSLDDIDLFACCLGPGSFTGVRIGIATVKAFADAKKIPVTGVSSLEGLAYNLINTKQLESDNCLICSMIDAKNNNVYCGLFEGKENIINLKSNLMADDINKVIDTINTFSDKYKQLLFVGDGSIIFKELLEKEIHCDNVQFAEGDDNIANSVSIAIAGYQKYIDGNFGNSNTLSPLYLRKSQAERALEEKSNI